MVTDAKVMQVQEIICLTGVPFPMAGMLCQSCAFTCKTLFLEQLRRKDEAIRQALTEKQQLVADILHVPKDEFENIAELAGEPSVDKEATELVLAAVSQGTSKSRCIELSVLFIPMHNSRLFHTLYSPT